MTHRVDFGIGGGAVDAFLMEPSKTNRLGPVAVSLSEIPDCASIRSQNGSKTRFLRFQIDKRKQPLKLGD